MLRLIMTDRETGEYRTANLPAAIADAVAEHYTERGEHVTLEGDKVDSMPAIVEHCELCARGVPCYEHEETI